MRHPIGLNSIYSTVESTFNWFSRIGKGFLVILCWNCHNSLALTVFMQASFIQLFWFCLYYVLCCFREQAIAFWSHTCPGTRACHVCWCAVLAMQFCILWAKCCVWKIPMAIWVYKVWKSFCSMPCLSELSRYTCSTDDTCPRHVIIYLLNQMLVPKNSNGYLGVQSVEKVL